MKKVLRNEEGFTLIEIIAVLVILGVLAAVAVPKYLNLMEESKKKAVEGAIAAGQSNVTMQYAGKLLTESTEGSALSAAISECSTNLVDLGDFSASYSCGSTDNSNGGWFTVSASDLEGNGHTVSSTSIF